MQPSGSSKLIEKQQFEEHNVIINEKVVCLKEALRIMDLSDIFLSVVRDKTGKEQGRITSLSMNQNNRDIESVEVTKPID